MFEDTSQRADTNTIDIEDAADGLYDDGRIFWSDEYEKELNQLAEEIIQPSAQDADENAMSAEAFFDPPIQTPPVMDEPMYADEEAGNMAEFVFPDADPGARDEPEYADEESDDDIRSAFAMESDADGPADTAGQEQEIVVVSRSETRSEPTGDDVPRDDWESCYDGWRYFNDPVIQQALVKAEDVMIKLRHNGFLFAAPVERYLDYPFATAFTMTRIEVIGGQSYGVIGVDFEGRVFLPEKT